MDSDEDEYHYSEQDDDDGEEYAYSDGNAEEEEEQETTTPMKSATNTPTPPTSSSSFKRAHEPASASAGYQILNRAEIYRNQQKMISNLEDLLCVSSALAQRILMQFQWDEEALMNTFMERGLDHILLTCNLAPNPNQVHTSSASCGICWEDFSLECPSVANPICSHAFCQACWEMHVKSSIAQGKPKQVLCAAQGCQAILHPDVLCQVLRNAPVELERYQTAMMESYIDDHARRAMWCPSKPNCGRAILLDANTPQRVDCECVCGEDVFCFACKGAPSHSPVPCEWAQEWLKKCESESENATFILAHCKPCPKCKKPIQKGDGCNHVTCICGQHMCWLCGAPTGLSHTYSSIAGHSCETYRSSSEYKTGERMKEKLDLYIHYFEKYEIHMQSLRKAREKESEVNATMDALNSRSGIAAAAANEGELADWLWIGLKQLFRMRRFVAWTYVLAYFAFYDAQGARIPPPPRELDLQSLFETLLNKLQNSVEDLSSYVEMSAERMDATTKPSVLALCHNTHQQASNLWNFCANDLFNPSVNAHLRASGGALTQAMGGGNTYFPIRRLVTGLGAKLIVDHHTHASVARQEDAEMEEDVISPAPAVAAAVAMDKKKKLPKWMNLG